jgi:hypothetical protein
MFKVHILDRCWYCQGKALLPMGEADHGDGVFTVYGKCPICQGTGESGRWVSLEEFAKLLADAHCKHEHTAFRGGMHFSAGDVWDDIEEYCIDCGANLDRQTLGDYIHDPDNADAT